MASVIGRRRFFFFKQKTAYEMLISDWSSDVCSSDLLADAERSGGQPREGDALRLGAEASWEIDLFGRVRRGIEAAEAEVGGAEALLRSARAAVTADVASHYFELRGSAEIGRASCRERVCQ